MALTDIITAAEADRTVLRVCSPTEYDGLTDRFSHRNVVVEHTPLPASDGEGFVIVRRGDEFVGSVSLDALDALSRPRTSAPGSRELEGDNFQQLLGLLDDTVFTSFDRRQMLATAREIEDRAWRTGRGTLYTGFQTLSAMEDQIRVYRQLATMSELDVHVFGEGNWNPPNIESVTVHATDSPAITNVWFVAFDGGGAELNRCALLAVEERPGAYQGFWTYDPERVGAIIDEIRSAVDMNEEGETGGGEPKA